MTRSSGPAVGGDVRLGLRENLPQFALLVVVNAFVGAMVGIERSILPAIAEQEFHLAARTALLSFIVVFGVAKALTNYGAGRVSDRFGRKHVLVAGWLVAVPVPFLLMWAPSWNWVLAANVLLGVSQGLTWSTTVIMKIDLVGARQRGLAMGLNEFAGYVAVAASALATGWIGAHYGLRPEPFYLGIGFVAVGLALSAFLVRETHHHVSHESALIGGLPSAGVPSARQVFWRTSVLDPTLSSVSQAGLVNNLNDGMAWLEPRANRDACGDVSRDMGHGPTGDRRTLRLRRPQTAHRLGHVDSGHRYLCRHNRGRFQRVRRRRRAAWNRHGHGVSDAPGGHRRCRPPDVARLCCRRLSIVA
jgi:hypothetical protein